MPLYRDYHVRWIPVVAWQISVVSLALSLTTLLASISGNKPDAAFIGLVGCLGLFI
jgi:hypothetical protein